MGKYKVFISDDNVEITTMLQQYLSFEDDFEVVGVAHDGEELLKNLPNVNPDILLLDIVMPKKDGMHVLQELKDIGLIDDMYIVMFTAMGQDAVIKKAIDMGVDYYFLKPVNPSSIIDKLKELVAESKNTNIIENDYDTIVQNELHKLGVPSHLKGYTYLKDVIRLVVDNQLLINQVTKTLYPTIAQKHDTVDIRVEKAIRNAIEFAYIKGNVTLMGKLFFNHKPTNSEFIGLIADKIRLQLKK